MGNTIPLAMIEESKVRDLLGPFGLQLTDRQMNQLLAYLSLLLRWNSKINLTSIRNAEDCVTRHFGESLYVSKFESVRGRMLDIGSGAGFPGLALKITFPELATTLLEPVGKKRAFLKEVVRVCEMQNVEVRPERLDEYVRQSLKDPFDFATCRAVGGLQELVPMAARCVKLGGRLLFWLGSEQELELGQVHEVAGGSVDQAVTWRQVARIPLSRSRGIWCGDVRSNAPH